MSFDLIKGQFGDSFKCKIVDGKIFSVICDLQVLKNMVNAKIRDDDVMICAYMRSGTHWTYEMAHMLLKGKAETVPNWKGAEQFEFVSCEDLDKLQSPRVLNTHLPFPDLPTDVSRVKPKIIFAVRDPRDVAVSNYNVYLAVDAAEYTGTWEGFLDLFVKGQVLYGSWFDYVSQWEDMINDDEYDILVLYYEDTHKNPVETVRKISDFLGLKRNEDLIAAIVEKCAFNNMREDKKDFTFINRAGEDVIYRKGTVSDWKNWFTVAQCEMFDEVMRQKMKNSVLAQRYLH